MASEEASRQKAGTVAGASGRADAADEAAAASEAPEANGDVPAGGPPPSFAAHQGGSSGGGVMGPEATQVSGKKPPLPLQAVRRHGDAAGAAAEAHAQGSPTKPGLPSPALTPEASGTADMLTSPSDAGPGLPPLAALLPGEPRAEPTGGSAAAERPQPALAAGAGGHAGGAREDRPPEQGGAGDADSRAARTGADAGSERRPGVHARAEATAAAAGRGDGGGDAGSSAGDRGHVDGDRGFGVAAGASPGPVTDRPSGEEGRLAPSAPVAAAADPGPAPAGEAQPAQASQPGAGRQEPAAAEGGWEPAAAAPADPYAGWRRQRDAQLSGADDVQGAALRTPAPARAGSDPYAAWRAGTAAQLAGVEGPLVVESGDPAHLGSGPGPGPAPQESLI